MLGANGPDTNSRRRRNGSTCSLIVSLFYFNKKFKKKVIYFIGAGCGANDDDPAKTKAKMAPTLVQNSFAGKIRRKVDVLTRAPQSSLSRQFTKLKKEILCAENKRVEKKGLLVEWTGRTMNIERSAGPIQPASSTERLEYIQQ